MCLYYRTKYRSSFAICDSRATVAVILFESCSLAVSVFTVCPARLEESSYSSVIPFLCLPPSSSYTVDGSTGIRIIVLLDLSLYVIIQYIVYKFCCSSRTAESAPHYERIIGARSNWNESVEHPLLSSSSGRNNPFWPRFRSTTA